MSLALPRLLVLGLLSAPAFSAVTPISLTGPVSDWDVIMKGSKFDPGNDQQASANPGVDIVGTDSQATLFTIYDDKGTDATGDDEVAFRVRLGGANSQGGFGGYLWIGLDVDTDGDLDAFMNVNGDGKTGAGFAGSLSVYATGAGLNNSPSSSSVTDPTQVVTLADHTTGGDLAFLETSSTLEPGAGLDYDINADANPDRLLTFKVSWSALAAAINAKPLTGGGGALIGSLNGNAGVSKATPIQFTLSTSTNSNNVNSDVGGYDNKNDDMSVSYADQGAFSPPLSFSNIFPVISSDGGGATSSVDVNENQAAVTTVVASDANGDAISYSIDGGSEAARFSIDGGTGVLTFAAAPDFEAPTDTAPTNSYVVTVQASDGKGGTDTQTLTVNVLDVGEAPVDGTPPAVASITRQNPLLAVTNADALVFRVTFSEAVSNVDAADFLAGGSAGGSVSGVSTVSSLAHDVTVTGITAANGTGNLGFSPVQDIVDTAGNALAVTTPAGSNESYTLDNLAPSASITGVPGLTNSAFTATITFSESVSGLVVDDVSVVNASLSGFTAVDGATYAVLVTPTADGAFSVGLAAGVAADDAGNGNTAAATANGTYDTSGPAAAITAFATDTGTAGDNLTSDRTLVLAGSSEGNADIQVQLDGAGIGTTAADAAGNWSFDYTGTPLPDGTYSFAAIATDALGNSGAASAALVVTIDGTAPATPAVTSISDDTGTAGDGVTSDTTLTISGTGPFDTDLEVFLDGVSIGTTSTDALGSWSLAHPTALADRTYAVTASSTDVAGNRSPLSPAATLVVDTAAPATPAFAQSMQTLSDTTPTLSGTADPLATVSVTLPGETLATQADASGNWSVTAAVPLAPGAVNLSVSATDPAGNASTALNDSFAVDVPISAANSSVTATPATIAADGISVSLVEIALRDTSDNPVTGATVTLLSTGGSLGPVSEIGGGLYRAALTAPLVSGGATVTARVGADTVGKTSLVFTPADADNDGTPNDTEDLDGDGDPGNDDLDGDGTPNYLDDDDDGDGKSTTEEDGNGNGDPFDDDSDGDGIPDFLDPDDAAGGDSDSDGLADTVECAGGWPCVDMDGDGLPDYNDGDDDNDGIPTAVEGIGRDTDDDGVPNYLDSDDDGDGLPTSSEDENLDLDGNPWTSPGPDRDGDGIPAYLDPNDADTSGPGDADGDGLPDDRECRSGAPCADSDGDGVPDFNDADDDNDGRPTASEDPNGDGDVTSDDTDGDGVADYLDSDDDGDRTPSLGEGGGDADGDGVPDYLDADSTNVAATGDGSGDSDGDGLSDVTECSAGLPCRDSDGDGTPDYMDGDDDDDGLETLDEDINGNNDPADDDTDNDGVPDYLDADDDNDGLPTLNEGTGDSDGDGIPDHLDPGTVDSDGDGLGDGIECPAAVPCPDSDGDGLADYLDADDDGDGVDTADEDLNGDGDPRTDDTDGDGRPNHLDRDDDDDGIPSSVEGVTDADTDGIPDYLDGANGGGSDGSGDSDGDGLTDTAECPTGVPCADTDGDGIPDYLDPDDDGDGLLTVDEDVNRNGDVTDDDTDGDGLPNYLDADDDGDGTGTADESSDDADGDGIPDHLDPATTDSDLDGVPDRVECGTGLPCRDSDLDGVPDYLDNNDDDDGLPTASENPNQKLGAQDDDTDGDGIPDYRDPDDDGDGIPTLFEGTGDLDGDGIPDYRDTDSSNLAGAPDNSGDSDRDGYPDQVECPGQPCRDANADGVPDYMQADQVPSASTKPRGGKVSTSVSGAGSTGMLLLLLLGITGLRRRGWILALLATLPLSLHAAADAVYAGVGGGRSWLEPGTSGTDWRVADENDNGWHLLGGWRWRDDVAFEGQFLDLGAAELANRSNGAREALAYDVLAALANWYPLRTFGIGNEPFGLFFQGGLSTMRNSSSAPHEEDHAVQLALGAGVEWRFRQPWTLRVAAQSFDRDASYLSLGVLRSFGGGARPGPETPPRPGVVDRAEPVAAAPVPVVIADADDDGVADGQDRCGETPAGTEVNEAGCSALDQTLEGITFASGSAALSPDSAPVLEGVVAALGAFPAARIELAAHTDAQGDDAFNQTLSEQRAASVKRYLVERGIDPARIETRGHGETRPVADDATAGGRARNRRVEMKLIGG